MRRKTCAKRILFISEDPVFIRANQPQPGQKNVQTGLPDRRTTLEAARANYTEQRLPGKRLKRIKLQLCRIVADAASVCPGSVANRDLAQPPAGNIAPSGQTCRITRCHSDRFEVAPGGMQAAHGHRRLTAPAALRNMAQ